MSPAIDLKIVHACKLTHRICESTYQTPNKWNESTYTLYESIHVQELNIELLSHLWIDSHHSWIDLHKFHNFVFRLKFCYFSCLLCGFLTKHFRSSFIFSRNNIRFFFYSLSWWDLIFLEINIKGVDIFSNNDCFNCEQLKFQISRHWYFFFIIFYFCILYFSFVLFLVFLAIKTIF